MDAEGKLLCEIGESFPPWNAQSNSFIPKGISNEQYCQLREDIYLFSDSALPRLLGLLMSKLLLDHPYDLIHDCSYDTFCGFFNVNLNEVQANSEGGDLINVRKEIIESLKDLTNLQSLCILKWLRIARDWGCSALLQSEFDNAIEYWESFQKGNRTGSGQEIINPNP